MASPSPAADPLQGQSRLGPYRVLKPISGGGMARVYEGRLDSLAGVSTRVALKVIHPDYAADPAFQELFITEARVSARLEHQNLVRIQQFNRAGDLYYLVMEYIDGFTFRRILSLHKRHGLKLAPELVAELGRQACEGLHYAHEVTDEHGEPLHLVHRDVKPSNLMLNAQGVVKLLDFGISYATGAREHAGSVKGTWGYMAPEQADGRPVGPAADVFGLAAVLYELAAGEPLFVDGEPNRVREGLAADEAARRAAALGGPCAPLGAVLVRALQRDPAARFPTAQAFGRALAALVPDPVRVHDELGRLFRELRRLEGAPPPPTPERPRSVSTLSRPASGAGGLPVAVGDTHGPVPGTRPSLTRPSQARGPSAVLTVGLGMAGGALVVGLLALLWYLRPASLRPIPAVPPPAPPVETSAAASRVFPPPGAPEPLPEPVAAASEPVAMASEPVAMASEPVAAASAPVAVASAPGAEPSAVAPSAAPPTAARAVASPVERPPTSRAPAPVAPSPSAPTEPAAARTPAEVPAPEPAPPVEPAPPRAAEPGGEGLLTVSSEPRAQVLIDGVYAAWTPYFQKPVAVGTHTVQLVTEDGRKKTFKVEVTRGQETRRIWLFDEERWGDAP